MSALQQMLLAAWKAAGSSTDVDPYFSNVALYLPMDGSNGGTTFTDVSPSPKAITANNATTTTTGPKFGTACGSFNGTNASLTASSNADFGIGTGDFTFETWIYYNAYGSGGSQVVFEVTTSGGMAIYTNDGAGVRLDAYGVGTQGTWSWSPSLSTWYHIAICRAGSSINFYVNGVKQGSTATSSYNFVAGALGIGGRGTSYCFNGKFDDMRLTKGIARYTNNFSVPTAAFPTTGNAPYATWNPSDKNSNVILGGGNLVASSSGYTDWHSVRATSGKSTGKWYWEETVTTVGGNIMTGFGKSTASIANTDYVGKDANGWGYYNSTGNKYNTGSSAAYGATYTTGDVIGKCLDLDNGTISFYKNNVFQGIAYTGISGTIYPMSSIWQSSVLTANFGQNPLKYTPPNGTFWNPKDVGSTSTFSNNNLTHTGTSGATWSCVRSNTSKSSGKWYAEFRAFATTSVTIGVGKSTASLGTANLGDDANGWGWMPGTKRTNATNTAYGATYTSSDVVGIALDLDAGTLTYYVNGVSQGQAFSGITGTLFLMTGAANNSGGTINTGATPFAYSPPSGYSAWDATVYNAGVY